MHTYACMASNRPEGVLEPHDDSATGEETESIERYSGEEKTVGSIERMLANLKDGAAPSPDDEVGDDV